MELCDFIKKKREKIGISQEKLGELIGKNRQYIYRLESGDVKSVKASIASTLAVILDCPLYVFFDKDINYEKYINTSYRNISDNFSDKDVNIIKTTLQKKINETPEEILKEGEKRLEKITAVQFVEEVKNLLNKTDLTEENKKWLLNSLGLICNDEKNKEE